jgi:protein-tyrosine-phosphatase
MRLLIVCAGNTCRSPMAEAIARTFLGERSHVESAGSETTDGLPPTKDALRCMAEVGLDISAHRSRELESLDLSNYDCIFAMTPSIRTALHAAGVTDNLIEVLNVPDPYGRGIEEYRRIRNQLQELLRARLTGDGEDSQ